MPHRDGGQSFVFVNDGAGGFERRVPIGPPDWAGRTVGIHDLDGDGRPDIVMGFATQGGASVFFNRGSAEFGDAVLVGDPDARVYSLIIRDLDGDGRSFDVEYFGDAEGATYGIDRGENDVPP